MQTTPRPRRALAGFLALGAALALTQACSSPEPQGGEQPTSRPAGEEQPTSQPAAADPAAAGKQAFLAASKVFLHPRCVNCHPSGDRPLQGEDSHPHTQDVKRGKDGRGKFALKCANCHAATPVPGAHLPPGDPNWRLPSEAMPLVFQGLSPAELARQLQDPARNGGKTLEQVLEHVAHDSLVQSCWAPDTGRELPPLSHEEFAARFEEWVRAGAPVPE